MKRAICLALAAFLLMTGALSETIAFAPLRFSFWGDPAQGYEWSCGYQENGVLSAPVENYVESSGGMGGDFTFQFEILSPGRAHIAFNYGPSDSLSVPSQTALCTVLAREDGTSDLFWARRYGDDHSVEITLPAAAADLQWRYVSEENDMARLVSQEFEEGADGSAGSARFLFSIEQPGATVLRFEYLNPWDPDAAAGQSYALDLTVNAEMEISMAVLDE